MSTKVQIKRSITSGARPANNTLQQGELAVNLPDAELFVGDVNQITQTLIRAIVLSTDRNSVVNPSAGQLHYNTTTKTLSVYTGGSWSSVGVPVEGPDEPVEVEHPVQVIGPTSVGSPILLETVDDLATGLYYPPWVEGEDGTRPWELGVWGPGSRAWGFATTNGPVIAYGDVIAQRDCYVGRNLIVNENAAIDGSISFQRAKQVNQGHVLHSNDPNITSGSVSLMQNSAMPPDADFGENGDIVLGIL